MNAREAIVREIEFGMEKLRINPDMRDTFFNDGRALLFPVGRIYANFQI